MKNKVLYSSLLLILAGLAVMAISFLLRDTLKYDSILNSIGLAWVFGGIFSVARYYYNTAPSRKEDYEKRLREEKISMHDERKIMLRQKSGQIMYQLMFPMLLTVNIFFTLAGVEMWIILTLYGFMVFQYVGGIIVFRRLSKKL